MIYKKTKCEVYSRAVGYLRPVSQWNPGKKEEFSERKCFKQDYINLKIYKKIVV